jgi:SAM-dependent methyltransferase
MDQKLSDRQIMNRIYKDLCGFEIPKNDAAQVRKSKGSAVYGEINHQALKKLHSYLKITSKDVFYDLGSGVGKVVLQTGLFTNAKKVVGVELSAARHEGAITALERAARLEPKIPQKCQFLNDDLMNVDLSEASIIYTCSTAFSEAFMKQVAKKVSSFPQRFKLVSLQELPDNYLSHIDTIRLDMSWVRNTAVHIYENK